MYLPVCEKCKYGTRKNGHSHCQRESVFSYLTNCIQKKALDDYLERNVHVDLNLDQSVGQ